MGEYQFIYGGEVWISASDREDAFQKLYAWLRLRMARLEIGEITQVRDAEGAAYEPARS